MGSLDASCTLDTSTPVTVTGGVTLKGDYNANTNSPDLDSSPISCIKKGDQYVVSVAGSFFTEAIQAGDSIISKQDCPTLLTHWIRVENNLIADPFARANHSGSQAASTISDFDTEVANNTTVAANTAKVTNATHTGDVTGSGALTIADNAVTLAKMAGGTDGELITYDTNGDPAAVAVGTATHVLTSNGAGAAPTFQAAAEASPLTTKGDVYTYDTGNARLGVGSDGEVLKADSSTATGLVWGSGGGGATATHAYTNQNSTSYKGTGTSGTGIDVGTAIATEASGAGEREIYIKKIDTNNEGVFTVIHKNGAAVEVQIA